jgi:hypothetical protein
MESKDLQHPVKEKMPLRTTCHDIMKKLKDQVIFKQCFDLVFINK